jgi:hypothetical protein
MHTLFNPLNAELNPICHLLAILAHLILHVGKIGVKSLSHGTMAKNSRELIYPFTYEFIHTFSSYNVAQLYRHTGYRLLWGVLQTILHAGIYIQADLACPLA